MKKEKVIKVLKVEPNKKPVVAKLANNLESLQKAVQGLIEIIELDEETCILCNEEGKFLNLEANRRLADDILCGVFYVTGQNKCGDLASLSPTAIEKYSKIFEEIPIITDSEVEKSIVIKFITF